MQASVATRVNELIGNVQNNMLMMEECSQKILSVAQDHMAKTIEWKNDVTSTDQDHSVLCSSTLTELNEARAIEIEKERRAHVACARKDEEEAQLEKAYANAQSEVDKIQSIAENKTAEVEELRDVIRISRDSAATRSSAINQREGRFVRKERGEMELIEKFESLLGLKVEAIEDQALLLTFTSIEASDPNKEYMATILSTDEKTYQAVNCVPPIPEFEHLSEALQRQDLGLAAFVKDLRGAFVTYANS